MKKKVYMTPVSEVKISHIQTYLHNFTKDPVNMAAPDLNTGDVGFGEGNGIGLNNDASGTVSFGKDRGDSGPWESIW